MDRPLTVADYTAVFDYEQRSMYAEVDALEHLLGFHLDRERLLSAARVLACPIKVHPPNWQHGRVLYAVARTCLLTSDGPVTMLDIGTAKGFSALCLQWALMDSGRDGVVHSVDIIDPEARVRRNTVAEVDGLLTLPEILVRWPEAASIRFVCNSGVKYLEEATLGRLNVAFVDGKHDGSTVRKEGLLIAMRQQSGDVIVFDDVNLPDLGAAVKSLDRLYRITYVWVLPERQYAIAVRR